MIELVRDGEVLKWITSRPSVPLVKFDLECVLKCTPTCPRCEDWFVLRKRLMHLLSDRMLTINPNHPHALAGAADLSQHHLQLSSPGKN